MNFVLGGEKYRCIWRKLNYIYNYCNGTSFGGLYIKDSAKIMHHAGGVKKPYELKYLT